MTAAEIMACGVATLPGTTLDAVVTSAALQTRTDRKYLVPLERVEGFVGQLASSFHVLEISGRRAFGYESVYFDTADMSLYRQHLQGRRRRYKVRSRSYLDSGDTMFEVKLKGARGQTIKSRLPYAFADRARITGEGRAFLEGLVAAEYGLQVPGLSACVTIEYMRTTLADLTGCARVTCDVDLVCTGSAETSGQPSIPAQYVLVETKSHGQTSPADLALRRLGIRPVSVSKYCVAVALLHDDMPANPWHRLLRRHFGYRPAMPYAPGLSAASQ